MRHTVILLREMLQQDSTAVLSAWSAPNQHHGQSNVWTSTPKIQSISCLGDILGILNLEITLRVCAFRGRHELGKECSKEKSMEWGEYRSPVTEKQVQQMLLFIEQLGFFFSLMVRFTWDNKLQQKINQVTSTPINKLNTSFKPEMNRDKVFGHFFLSIEWTSVYQFQI